MAKRTRKSSRVPKLATLQQHISHIRKMISRIEKTQIKAPSDTKIYKFKRFGSRFYVDGVEFKPADLEALAGQGVEWRLQAIAWLQDKLSFEERRKARLTGKAGKITVSTKAEIDEAIHGEGFWLTTEDVLEFNAWLNSGSPGWKKNLYYHIFGADSSRDLALIKRFITFMGYKTLQELIENE